METKEGSQLTFDHFERRAAQMTITDAGEEN
jgi:hypothetical protein